MMKHYIARLKCCRNVLPELRLCVTIGPDVHHVTGQSRAFQEPVRKKKNKTNPRESEQRADSIEKRTLNIQHGKGEEVQPQARRLRGCPICELSRYRSALEKLCRTLGRCFRLAEG